MLIFNTTYLVENEFYPQWINWVQASLIPFMMSTADFSEPQIAKVLTGESVKETSYSVQFKISDKSKLNDWMQKLEKISLNFVLQNLAITFFTFQPCSN